MAVAGQAGSIPHRGGSLSAAGTHSTVTEALRRTQFALPEEVSHSRPAGEVEVGLVCIERGIRSYSAGEKWIADDILAVLRHYTLVVRLQRHPETAIDKSLGTETDQAATWML